MKKIGEGWIEKSKLADENTTVYIMNYCDSNNSRTPYESLLEVDD